MDKSGGYTGSRPASEMGPPAQLPSATIRPGGGASTVVPGVAPSSSTFEPILMSAAFDDDEENTGPLPILGRDFLAVTPTKKVLAEVGDERASQEAKWGQQNHPDGTHLRWSEVRDNARRFCDEQHKAGVGTWLDILLEEVYETAAETDTAKLRVELLQVAAVAAAWVEAIDRRTS